MKHDPTNLVIGRGEVYFDRFSDGSTEGEGEFYLGNTPSFQITRSLERIDRFVSYRGRKYEALGNPLSETLEVQITTDHMSADNLGLWYSNTPSHIEVESTERSEKLAMRKGFYYQLGKGFSIGGVKNLAGVEVDVGAEGVDYELDRARGRIKVSDTYPDDILVVHVSYFHGEGSQAIVIPSAREVSGALRIVGKSGLGPVTGMYFPMVSIAPDAAVQMKSSEFRQMRLKATAHKVDRDTPLAYILHSQEQPIGWVG